MSLNKIEYVQPYCPNTEFVLIVITFGISPFQANLNPGIISVAVISPRTDHPSRAPYIGHWAVAIENKHKRKASIEDTEVYIKDLMKKIRLSDSPNCKNIEPNNVDYAFVLDVVYSMPNVFDDEKARKEEFRRLFREHYKITFNDYAGERMTTDGTSFSKGGMYMISNLEVKPESGVGGCCPYNQGNAYYAKYIANLPIQDIIKTQLPCFLLYLAGPYIGIAGVIFGEKFLCDPLTLILPLFHLPQY
ncbi:22745_t:CDS:2 [Entrophospora sp. SA101]|nr:22745_t:CDS:2 [Entrophospora sp. SA101]